MVLKERKVGMCTETKEECLPYGTHFKENLLNIGRWGQLNAGLKADT